MFTPSFHPSFFFWDGHSCPTFPRLAFTYRSLRNLLALPFQVAWTTRSCSMSCSKHSVTASYSKSPLLKSISLNYKIKFKNDACVCVHMCICLQRSEDNSWESFLPLQLVEAGFSCFWCYTTRLGGPWVSINFLISSSHLTLRVKRFGDVWCGS